MTLFVLFDIKAVPLIWKIIFKFLVFFPIGITKIEEIKIEEIKLLLSFYDGYLINSVILMNVIFCLVLDFRISSISFYSKMKHFNFFRNFLRFEMNKMRRYRGQIVRISGICHRFLFKLVLLFEFNG